MDLAHYSKFLSHLPIFSSLDEAEIADICRTFKIRNITAGTALCREGEAARSMFILERGRVRVTKKTAQGDEQELAIVKAPSVVGEMALLDGGERSATVTALEPVMAYEMECEGFSHLRLNGSTAASKIIRNLALTLCERLRNINDKIDTFFRDPEGSLEKMRQRQQELWAKRQQHR